MGTTDVVVLAQCLCLAHSGIFCILGKCCQCSDAAFKLVAEMGLTEDNIVHTSEKNEVCLTAEVTIQLCMSLS